MSNNIKIVEYDPSYAESVAEMWIKSKDGWNGSILYENAEAVERSEKNSIHLNLWLALDNETVVGYCKLTEMKEEKALNLDYLNVRSDYHGKKIGKMLVLKAVEKTIEMGQNRIDLYTWPGNLKAVPLYKKCGYFWEKSENSTHLVNLIPYCLNTELVKEYFETIDWYQDSKRKIMVEPDGRKENEFEYLTYSWQKDDKHLSMEFSRRGRGLRKIDCNEFEITATVEDLNLVFGRKYKIAYEVINKTNKPLLIEIKGKNDKKITFDFTAEKVIETKEIIEAEFYVDKIEKEYRINKNHPCVAADILVNGKKAEFKVGIAPKFPAKISLIHEQEFTFTEVPQPTYLQIENCFKEKAEFNFKLINTDEVSFSPQAFTVKMDPEEKKSLPIEYTLLKAALYAQDIIVNVKLESGENFDFTKKLYSLFMSENNLCYGKTDTAYICAAGSFYLQLNIEWNKNAAFTNNLTDNEFYTFFGLPELGEPYADEFQDKLPEHVSFLEENNSVTMAAEYKSDKFPEIELIRYLKVASDGRTSQWFAVKDNLHGSRSKPLKIKSPFSFTTPNVIPYDGEIYESPFQHRHAIHEWKPEKIDEPWMFTCNEIASIALHWDKEQQLQVGAYSYYFEDEITAEKTSTKPINFQHSRYRDWKTFRESVLKKKIATQQSVSPKTITINDGNPFVQDDIKVSLLEKREIDLVGKITACSSDDTFPETSVEFKKEEKCKRADLKIDLPSNQRSSIITVRSELMGAESSSKCVAFRKSNTEIVTKIETKESMKIFTVDNGLIEIKAAPDFAPVLYSCSFKGNEWLDSSFPKVGPKCWENPWAGGISSAPGGIRMDSRMKESITTDFVEMNDNQGNLWKGICIATEIVETKAMKGFRWKDYFMLLPGVPVLLHTSEIFQDTGTYYQSKRFITNSYIKQKENYEDISISFVEKGSGAKIVHPGENRNMSVIESNCIISGKSSNKESLHMLCRDSTDFNEIIVVKDMVQQMYYDSLVPMNHGDTHLKKPKFFIFAEEKYDEAWLDDLKGIELI